MGVLFVFLSVVVAMVAASASGNDQPDQNLTDAHSSVIECNQLCSVSSLNSKNFTAAHVHGCQCSTELKEMTDLLKDVTKTLERIHRRPRHCKDHLEDGDGQSGVRVIHPYPEQPYSRVKTYCDQTTDGGGWTVIQRRTNLTFRENFNRTWKEYRLGFGDIEGEFWLGLDAMHGLTETSLQELRIDLEDWEGNHRYAKYNLFHVDAPATMYILAVSGYSGNAGDSFTDMHSGSKFTTIDQDNDADGSMNCARRHKGGWWFYGCHSCNLNGLPHQGEHVSDGDGINWENWRGYHYSHRRVSMMTRPAF